MKRYLCVHLGEGGGATSTFREAEGPSQAACAFAALLQLDDGETARVAVYGTGADGAALPNWPAEAGDAASSWQFDVTYRVTPTVSVRWVRP